VHAPHHGEFLFGASVLIGGWTAINGAPLAAAHWIGPAVYRAGLAVLVAGMVAVGLHYLTDVAVSGPLFLAAVALGQAALTLTRRRPPAAPATEPPPVAPPPPVTEVRAATADKPVRPGSVDVRQVGYAAGMLGNAIGKEAQRAVPAGARKAGRGAGRLLARRLSRGPAPIDGRDERAD
jgi:hypothetical protein